MDSLELIPHRPEADSFDIRGSLIRLFEACWAYKLVIVTTTILTLALVVTYMKLWQPIYKADVLIVADSKDDTSRENFYQLWNVFRKETLNNEAQQMGSRKVLSTVVRDLNLTYDDIYHPFLNHAAYLWGQSWVGQRYRGVKYFFFPKKKSLYGPTDEEIEFARTVTDFGAGIKLQPMPDSTVGRLIVKGPSPRVAEMANKLMETYLADRKERYVEEARTAFESLSAETARASANLIAVEEERRRFHEKNGLLLQFEGDKIEVSQAAELRSSILEMNAALVSLKSRREGIREQLAAEAQEITSARVYQQNTLREEMKSTRFLLQTELDGKRQRYRVDSPEVLDLEERIAKIDQQIADQQEKIEGSKNQTLNTTREDLRKREMDITTELESALAGLAVRRKTYEDLSARVARIPEKMAELQEIERRQYNEAKRYELLATRMTQAEVSMATAISAPPSMRVADAAAPPAKPTWPKTKLLLLGGLVVGFGAGIGLALLLDSIQGRVTRTRLLQHGTGIPLYGVLELASQQQRALLGHGQGAAIEPDRIIKRGSHGTDDEGSA